MFCGRFFGFCGWYSAREAPNTLIISALAIRAIFGDICGRVWLCWQICPNFEGTKNAFVTKKAKKVTKVILAFYTQYWCFAGRNTPYPPGRTYETLVFIIYVIHPSVLPFIRVIRVIRGLISCVSHNLIVPLAAPKVLRHGCVRKNAGTFSCVSHNLIVPLSQFYGNA